MKNILLTPDENYLLRLIKFKNAEKKVRLSTLPAHYLKALIRYALLKRTIGRGHEIPRHERQYLKNNFYSYLGDRIQRTNISSF